MASPEAKKTRRFSNPISPGGAFDWTACVICQEKTISKSTGPLLCPGLNFNPSAHLAGYKTLEENLLSFKRIQALPTSVKLQHLDDGAGIANTLAKQNAKYHRACYLKFNGTQLKRAEKRARTGEAKSSENSPSPSPLRLAQARASSCPSPLSSKSKVEAKCIICGGPATRREVLRRIQSEERSRELTLLVQASTDENLRDILKAQNLAGVDFQAQGTAYHNTCWIALRNSGRKRADQQSAEAVQLCESLAFADLHTHIQDNLDSTESRCHKFKMSELTQIYARRLAELDGSDLSEMTPVHSTRLRERIMAKFPELIEEKIGREYQLISEKALKNLVKNVDKDEDAIALRRTVLLLQDEMNKIGFQFDGEFPPNCQENSIPSSLLAVISSIMYGPSAVNVGRATQPVLAVCQTLMYNYRLVSHSHRGPAKKHSKGTLRLLGDVLEGSGWVRVLAASGVMSETAANAALQVQHLKRARRAHEMTIAVLYILLHQAYEENNEGESLDVWVQKRADASPTFFYWLLVLNLETLYFLSLKSVRGQDYELYKECLTRILPWFFVVNRLNYAKALSIHLTDLTYLSQVAPTVQEIFSNGFFALNKTSAPHSAIAADQFHEQNNAILKAELGASGRIHSDSKMRGKVLVAPEIARLRHEFSLRATKQKADSSLHHEQTAAHQQRFQTNIWKLKEAFESIGNPFHETTPNLVAIDSGVVMSSEPRTSKTYAEYWAKELLPHILRDIQKFAARRIDLVFDTYNALSIKEGTRAGRGTGVRRRVQGTTALPRNWQDFLRNPENKTELFRFLAWSALAEKNLNCAVNMGDTMLVSADVPSHLGGVSCAHQDEADGRLILHVADMVTHGARKVKIRTVDSDVLVLAVSFYGQLQQAGLSELWVEIGTGPRHRYIAAHAIAVHLGDQQATALRGFHAFSGCDTVSAFVGKGKKSCWKTWNSNLQTTPAFFELSQPVATLSQTSIDLLVLFCIHLYNGKDTLSLEENRRIFFPKRKANVTMIPPTTDALMLHISRAVFQAGQIWGQAHLTNPTMPSPSQWGWRLEDKTWVPKWTTLPPIWEACREMRGCGCKGDCSTNQCSCHRDNLPCFPLCANCTGVTCANTISSRSPAENAPPPERDSESGEEDVDDPDDLTSSDTDEYDALYI
ncbi:hypothetical protein FOCC_FOCC007347 [Frankliniella occidentalis]|nr:hypothetical protein FOCC_FOCC007347 [Frankliniella occidentalis]